MQFTTGRSRRISLDITPLINVVLMLVIFFMLTTTFVLTPSMQGDLSQGRSTQRTVRMMRGHYYAGWDSIL